VWVTFKDVCVSVEKSGVYIYKKSVASAGVYPLFSKSNSYNLPAYITNDN